MRVIRLAQQVRRLSATLLIQRLQAVLTYNIFLLVSEQAEEQTIYAIGDVINCIGKWRMLSVQSRQDVVTAARGEDNARGCIFFWDCWIQLWFWWKMTCFATLGLGFILLLQRD